MKRGLIISAWWAATPDRNVTRRTHAEYLCRSAPFPRCPARFSGCMGSAPLGTVVCMGGATFKDIVASQSGMKVVRCSQNIRIHACFISKIGWWNKTATCAVLFACSRMAKGWGGKTVRKIEKKKAFSSTGSWFSNLMAANQNSNFYGACRLTSFHLFSFILFVVADLWKLKAKACDSCWEPNCHKLPLLTRWWIAFISASPLI